MKPVLRLVAEGYSQDIAMPHELRTFVGACLVYGVVVGLFAFMMSGCTAIRVIHDFSQVDK